MGTYLVNGWIRTGSSYAFLDPHATACILKSISNSSKYEVPGFYGWYVPSPINIGPMALIRFAQTKRDKIIDRHQETVRGIECDMFQLIIKDDTEDIEIIYYFADKNWIAPDYMKDQVLRVPIRVTVKGVSGKYAAAALPVNQIVDFAYFTPVIEELSDLQPPIGLGCVGRESEKYLKDIPNEFQFMAESYDLLDAKNHADTVVNFHRIFFSYRQQLARMDLHEKMGSKSELHDFNTGVTYSIENGAICKIKPLSHSYFLNEGEIFQGHMKTAKEVLFLNGNFYYMGKRQYRGLDVEVYEAADYDTSFMDYYYYLVVRTVFFSSDYTQVANRGEDMINVPVYTLVTAYDYPNHISEKLQFNIFAFDDVVGPFLYADFPIANCFPLSEQKSFFVLIMAEGPETAKLLKGNNQMVIEKIKDGIGRIANVSAMRLPVIQMDYESEFIAVTGLMLNRPPALKQFELFDIAPTEVPISSKLIVDSENDEQCAYACADDPTCWGFYYCGKAVPKEGACFLSTGNQNPILDDELKFTSCYRYYRSEMNSNNKEAYLMEALETLDVVVTNGNFKISVPINLDALENDQVELTITDVLIGEGPFDKSAVEKSYSLVYNGYQLKAEIDLETTIDKDYVETELECFRTCENEESISCQSFSFCPQGSKKECRINEEFVSPNKVNDDLVVANTKCNVHSLTNLAFFEPNPGKVMFRPGKSSLTKILSAEECAMKCKTESKFRCRGFEYCKSDKSCVLHNTHVIDINPSEMIPSKDTKCVHYSVKFSADYVNSGHLIIKDDSDSRKAMKMEECARACSEEIPSCKAFVYCPLGSTEAATCSLTKKSLASPGIDTEVNEKCHLYSKKKDVKDWGSKQSIASKDAAGYTRQGMAGLVIGMIVFGLVVGIIGFVGYSYYRSRRVNDGMSVKFVKTNA